MRRRQRVLVFFMVMVTAALVALIVTTAPSDESGPVAGALSSSTTTTVVEDPADPIEPAEAADPTEPAEAADPTEPESPGLTLVPFEPAGPSEEIGVFLAARGGDPAPVQEVEFVWWDWDATGVAYFTYLWEWETDDDSGSGFGELPPGTDHYIGDVPCETRVQFDLLAWSAADAELGRGSSSYAGFSCEHNPMNLAAYRVGSSVVFEWINALGHDRYVYELTKDGAGTDIGTLGPDLREFEVEDVACETRVDFALSAISALTGDVVGPAGTVTTWYETEPCP